MQESGLSPVLEGEAVPLTVLAPTNKGLAIEQLDDFEAVCIPAPTDEYSQLHIPQFALALLVVLSRNQACVTCFPSASSCCSWQVECRINSPAGLSMLPGYKSFQRHCV